MADNICPNCGFPNEKDVRVCKKCKTPYSLPEYSHIITSDNERDGIVEKTNIEFKDEDDSHRGIKADIHFDTEEGFERPTQPIPASEIISRQFYAATFGQRLLSLLIDLILILVCTLIIWFFGIAFTASPDQILGEKSTVKLSDILSSIALLYFLFGFFYSMLFHYLTGSSIGKMLMGLHLVSKDSYRVSFYRIIFRNLFFLLNILTLFIGYIWIIADERGQALHDKLSKTFVVSEEIK